MLRRRDSLTTESPVWNRRGLKWNRFLSLVRGEEKHNANLPRNIEPAGLAILQGKQESKRKNGGSEKPTACHRLRQLIVKNPMWDVDVLLKQLESEGYNKTPRSTVSTFRSDTRATLKALVAEGLINIEL